MKREPKRVKRTRDEYDEQIARAMRTNNPGLAEWLATRCDRDWPEGEEI